MEKYRLIEPYELYFEPRMNSSTPKRFAISVLNVMSLSYITGNDLHSEIVINEVIFGSVNILDRNYFFILKQKNLNKMYISTEFLYNIHMFIYFNVLIGYTKLKLVLQLILIKITYE